jgi:hypothetical protein
LAWREALEKSGIELAVWRIHRRIGMSGGLLIDALLRETRTGLPRPMPTVWPSYMKKPTRVFDRKFALFPARWTSWPVCRGPVCPGPLLQVAGPPAPSPC